MKPNKFNKIAAVATLAGTTALASMPSGITANPETKPNLAPAVELHQNPGPALLEDNPGDQPLVIERKGEGYVKVDPVSGQPTEANGLPEFQEQQSQIADAAVQVRGSDQTTR